jgi:HSP20 family molecular chaperone IbpA
MRQTQELVALQRRVEGWRREAGGRGSRIPEKLWSEAVAVSRRAGLYVTARALRFNYENLKRRARREARRPSQQKTEFVAVQLPQVSNGLKVVIDLAGRDGEQVRIEVSGGSAMDVVALADAFWKRRS